MKCTRKCNKSGFTTIIWAIIPTLICFAPCFGEDINGTVPGFLLVDGTETDGMVNLLPGADIELGVYVYPNGVLNIYGGTVGPLGITLLEPTPTYPGDDPVVTVYGMDFAVDPGTIVDDSWTPGGSGGTLTGTYENGDSFTLLFYSVIPIYLVDTSAASPEELIAQLIDDVKTLNLKEGIENSLDAKLQNALAALEAANAGQRQDAVNKMDAFISAVEAQSGKAIDENDAAILIESALAIISLL